MVMVTLSIVATIVILNVHVGFESALPTKFHHSTLSYRIYLQFRSPATHRMRPWVRLVFIKLLPKLLFVERPRQYSSSSPSHRNKGGLYYHKVNQNQIELQQFRTRSRAADRRPLLTTTTTTRPDVLDFEERRYQVFRRTDIRKVVDGINFIADHFKEAANIRTITQDWKYVALVLDRLFLWIFAAASVIGFAMIILDAPSLYESHEPIPRTCERAVAPGSDDAWFCLFQGDDV
ncbi:putative Acetylcholine receptor subunit alpha-like 1 [Hypsibius exemplaris]|uniref:Acetylcholine receptor subunit alpha-like 1 n=1 Tax=Hypsibius exemplaris TaxID=2072580 RepID=A0A1W0WJ72_HYPEX|nr:putative Acetylcholine receptor subunit alpha-like 1 [Hypsibius exemplaris]